MKFRPISFLGAVGLLAAFLPSSLSASSVQAISFTGVNSSDTLNNGEGPYSLGFEFSTNTAIDVTALGFFDATLVNSSYLGLGNCSGCGEVGIYNSSGTLLVSTPTPVTTSDTQVGDFFYETIPTTSLAAGQDYYIVAETGNADYTADVNATGYSVDPSIAYIQDEYVVSSSLAFPTLTDGATVTSGIFGPNFEETSATSAVPEPSSVSLLAMGLGLVAFCATRKRLQNAKPAMGS
ncbi:MAG: PEP-CTERM sorting domain-containing protein [Bryobacteraceae bacterium]